MTTSRPAPATEPVQPEQPRLQDRPHDGNSSKEPRSQEQPLWRCLLAETFGTFALTLVAAGGEVIAVLSHGEVSHSARMVAPGLLVMAMIYAIGDASGAHFNPAVTALFTLRGAFPIRRAVGYWLTQFAGATLAGLLLRALFGMVKRLGASTPQGGVMPALVMEVALSTILFCVILGTATRYSLVGHEAALAVGGTIALCGLFASPISGASMNPARSIGPMIAGDDFQGAWIYVVGPLVGACIAAGLMALLHPKSDPKEGEAAEGKQ